MKVTKWKVENQGTFWMIITSWRIIWMKHLIGWNAWMELIPKQLWRMKTTSKWMKVIRRMKYLDERGAWMNFWMMGSRQIVRINDHCPHQQTSVPLNFQRPFYVFASGRVIVSVQIHIRKNILKGLLQRRLKKGHHFRTATRITLSCCKI
jgi:hypothetical protein